MTPMAELEIDDVAFLTGESRSHQNACDVCLCGRSSSSTRSRRNKSPPGLASLFTMPCNAASPTVRPILLVTISGFVLFFLLLIALLFAFANPFSHPQTCLELSQATFSVATSLEDDIRQQLIATNGEPFPWQDVRLPKIVLPVHYDLFMHPNLTTFSNKGSIEVILTVHEQTNFIVMHSKQLNITGITVTAASGSIQLTVKRYLLCALHEQLYIEFDGYLEPTASNYSLKVSFNKLLEEKLEGFYISSYNESNGGDRKRYVATTHFEPTAARSAFPCFDEPAMKATFALRMVHEPQHDVYFNSDRQTKLIYNPDGLFMSVFDETVRMSTYLVAFTVCDFKTMSARTKEGIHVRVLVPSDQYNQAEYALFSATAILTYFQEFFNVTYPLSKLDLMAVPDFSAGK